MLTPEWKKAATVLRDVKVRAVDAGRHQSLGDQYGVQGFPTIKIFGASKTKPEYYQGGRTREATVDVALSALHQLLKDCLGRHSSVYCSGKQVKGDSSCKKDMVELTDDTFDYNVLVVKTLVWLDFMFHGVDINLEPEWW
ncbi:rCG28329 [Rattus norvegicus]|uniref:RCG28329 n=1 Tax=Rattus norvegicus TaxID=10116 RepID=A6IE44_RAT|nr:uncharacterized protein LOC685171 [Rattus norvegicus]EDM15131.1 rCG28329 [Rattus norvegicus]|eukprot:NP_001102929.1 uncharacterized protein LOC685171 [Rattus norvegicus]